MLIGGGLTVLGLVAFVVAELLVRGDHRIEQCDALRVGCTRVHAYYGFAAAGWALLVAAVLAVVTAGVRRLRNRRSA